MKKTTSFWIRNVAALLLVFLVIKALVGSFGGYPWLLSMLRSNAELIHRYPNLTTRQKNEAKQGFPFSFMDFVKVNTPPDAVILFPPRDTLLRIPELKDKPSNSSSRLSIPRTVRSVVFITQFYKRCNRLDNSFRLQWPSMVYRFPPC